MDGPPIEQLKHGRPSSIPIRRGRAVVGRLRPVRWADAHDPGAIARLAGWHAAAFPGGPGAVTAEGVRQWLLHRVLADPRRALFWVEDADGSAVGHVGVSDRGAPEAVDRLVAGPAQERLMGAAAAAAVRWAERSAVASTGSA